MNRIIKWVIIVAANATFGFLIAVEERYDLIGMVSGIFTWTILYIILDFYLIKRGYITLSKKLTISTCIRIPLQFTGMDVFVGMAAVFTVEEVLGLTAPPIVEAYLLTLFTGFYLSIVCAVILSFLYLITHLLRGSNNNII